MAQLVLQVPQAFQEQLDLLILEQLAAQALQVLQEAQAQMEPQAVPVPQVLQVIQAQMEPPEPLD
jgi:hypothetical protein